MNSPYNMFSQQGNNSSLSYHSPHTQKPISQDSFTKSEQSQEAIQLEERISHLEETLNRECSRTDSMMPVLQLYDIGAYIGKYEQEVKNLNKKIGCMIQMMNSDNHANSRQLIDPENQHYRQLILSNKIKELLDDCSHRNQPDHVIQGIQRYNTNTAVQQYKSKVVDELATFKNEVLSISCLPSSVAQYIPQNSLKKTYQSLKQKNEALLINIKHNLPKLLSDQQQQDQHDDINLEGLPQKIAQLSHFHQFTYNRISKQMLSINRQLETIFDSILQGNDIYLNEEAQSIESSNVCLKMIGWQLKGMKKKYYVQLSECHIIVNRIRSGSLDSNGFKIENKGKSLYQQLINYNSKQPEPEQQLQQLQYTIYKYQEEFSRDLDTLEDIHNTIYDKYRAIETEKKSKIKGYPSNFIKQTESHRKNSKKLDEFKTLIEKGSQSNNSEIVNEKHKQKEPVKKSEEKSNKKKLTIKANVFSSPVATEQSKAKKLTKTKLNVQSKINLHEQFY